MFLYRISNRRHAGDVSGTGAKLFGGRWNSIGTPLHYMTASRALAALEVLTNRNSFRTDDKLCLTVFELPENSIKVFNVEDLPADWKSFPALAFLAQYGDRFIRENKYLLLKVPSAIIDDEFNFLMNVQHPLAEKIEIKEIKPFYFDGRLL